MSGDLKAVLLLIEVRAVLVDKQNSTDADSHPMSPDYNTNAFYAACDLIFLGWSGRLDILNQFYMPGGGVKKVSNPFWPKESGPFWKSED